VDTPQQVRYADLARELEVCPIQLAERHARDLRASGQSEHARRALDAAEKLRRAKHFPAIDPQPIQLALAACRATGLSARIAERAADFDADLPDALAQAAHIARLLEDAKLSDYATLIDIPLEETIDRAATGDQLDALARFLRAIVRACAATARTGLAEYLDLLGALREVAADAEGQLAWIDRLATYFKKSRAG